MSKEIELPFVELKNGISGLLYTNRDGSKVLFDGRVWFSLLQGTDYKEGIFKKGTIRKFEIYTNYLNNECYKPQDNFI